MGEVYKAHDESLERAVALKILPPELTRNDERVRRFVQEAKSASSLSHPHIVSIYEIGQAEVQDEGESHPVHFIAMELVDGRTLKREIHEERTDLRTLLEYMAQVADGLAKAHSAGIIHRDLKPENVMISKDGYAKVLDFGLAKLTEKRSTGDGQTDAPTAVRERTREGTIMGTVGYMSPEQVQGKNVDHRSDIFSFGTLLYEAATRQRAFDADSDVDIMHKILHDRPQPVDELNPQVPTEVRRMIKRCMARDPERRYQSMKDIAIELSDILEEWETLSPASRSGSSFPSGPAAATSSRRTLALIAVLATVALLALAGLFWSMNRKSAPPAAGPEFSISRLTGSGNALAGAISPDGRYIAYIASHEGTQSVRVRQISTGSEVEVAEKGMPIRGVSFSADGDYIYFTRSEDTGPGYSNLFQVPALGGAPRKIIFDIDTSPSFSPDGKQFAFVRGYPQFGESAVMIANADGSGERKLATSKDPTRFPNESAVWSPDGKVIVTTVESQEGGLHGRLVVIDAATGKMSDLGGRRFEYIHSAAWLPDGSGVVAVAFEPSSQAHNQIWLFSYPTGEARRISSDLSEYSSLSLTADGKAIAATQQNRTSNLWIVPPAGPPRKVTTGSAMRVGDLQAGARRLYFADWTSGTLRTANLDGSDLRPLLNDDHPSWGPSVPADESFIVFVSLREGNVPHIFRVNPDGTGLRRITRTPTRGDPPHVSPDGTNVTFISPEGAKLMKMPADGSGAPVAIAEGAMGGGRWSPDGTMIAYGGWLRDPSGREMPRMVIIRSAGGMPIASFSGRSRVGAWAPDSRSGDLVPGIEGGSNIWRQPLDGSAPKKITSFDDGTIHSFAWGNDGTLYLGRGEVSSDMVLITGFRAGAGGK
jgi:eukaryotic-like serine/threonine-protein kinase